MVLFDATTIYQSEAKRRATERARLFVTLNFKENIMAFYKITVDDEIEDIIGDSECTTLELKIVSGRSHDKPWLFAQAFTLENEQLKKRIGWSFSDLGSKFTLRVESLNTAESRQPDEADNREGLHVKEERLYIKENVQRLERINPAYKSRIEYLKSGHDDFCGFCGRTKHESNVLLSGPILSACDQCITLMAETISDGEKCI